MNNTDTETAIYVNLGISILHVLGAVMTHMGWFRFQSSCCTKEGGCCHISEEMGTEGTKPSEPTTPLKPIDPVPTPAKKE